MDSTRDMSCSLAGGSVIKTDYGVTVRRVWSGILLAVLDLKVVEKGFEVVLGGEAGIEQKAFDTGPFTETSIIEHLQVVGDDEGNDTSR